MREFIKDMTGFTAIWLLVAAVAVVAYGVHP